ncbi:unnamed protein product [Caretta caretta]
MDRGSRFFYALEKRSGAKKHITYLLAEDGTPLMDPAEMCRRARAFYTGLLSPDLTVPEHSASVRIELPTVSAGNRDWLELPLTLAEFSEALCCMSTNKSPGMDGADRGVLPWSVLVDVIHPDQTYTVPGRTIFDILYLVRDLGCRDGRLFALLSLDQEKVFNRVDHGYLLSTLRAFDFGPQFVGFSRRLTRLVLRELELRLVLLAYADDVLLVVQDPGDLAHVEACQAIYSAASSPRSTGSRALAWW